MTEFQCILAAMAICSFMVVAIPLGNLFVMMAYWFDIRHQMLRKEFYQKYPRIPFNIRLKNFLRRFKGGDSNG